MGIKNERAMDAWLRGGGGPMKDRRTPRGGATNAATTRDEIAEALAELAEAEEDEDDRTEG